MVGNALSSLIMYGWLPLVLLIFAQFPAQRAVVIGFIGAWLFLPLVSFKFPGIPEYNKMAATSYGILIGTLMYDPWRIQSFKFKWIDIPMFVWSVCPFLSSMTNNLGVYDGFSASFGQAVTWGFPYFVGRIYLNTLSGLRQLALGIFYGGVIYIPFCLYEVRMSINLHGRIYGVIHPASSFIMSIRYGGYRPSIFMESGLMLGVYMMSATLIGIVLWRTRIVKSIVGLPMSLWVLLLLITFVLVKATGAYNLLAFGILILFVAKWFRTSLMLWVIVAAICGYLSLGVTGQFPRQEIISTLSSIYDAERLQSLDYRYGMEEILGDKARQQIVFGWGGFGRNRVTDETGRDITVTDSLWIIVFGVNGLVGLISLMSALLLPPIAFSFRFPAPAWSTPLIAPAAALAVCLIMYALDCVLNAMVNPIFALTCGGLAGLVVNDKPKG